MVMLLLEKTYVDRKSAGQLAVVAVNNYDEESSGGYGLREGCAKLF